MGYRVAINGFGRIGRAYLRCLLERGLFDGDVSLVAVNDLWDPVTLGHLLAYDSTVGPLGWDVETDPGALLIAGTRVPVLRERDPGALPWAELGVDLVIEATGRLRGREDAGLHLKAGAGRVLITATGTGADATLVAGVNDQTYDPEPHRIISAGSCTTACAAPMLRVLHNAFGVRSGHITAVRAYTNGQSLLDAAHADPRLARSATANIIPTLSGAADAVGAVLPVLSGRLDSVALRVPVENGSLVQLSCELLDPGTPEEVHAAFAAAARCTMPGILRITERPVVSRDIIGDPASCVLDALLTRTGDRGATVFGWYDDEWGYANRLVDLTGLMASR